jgi:hypothetical protein
MATTLSYQGILYRSNVFDKTILRKFSGSSGEANKEFSLSLDLTDSALPASPYQVSTQGAGVISFLFIQAIGGAVKLQLVKTKEGGTTLPEPQVLDIAVGDVELLVGDTLLMSGIDINELYVTSVPKGCILEIYGMGF